jgi:hypothetical protein
MKRAVLILSIVSIVLFVIGFVMFFAAGAAVAAANCTTDASGQLSCPNGNTPTGALVTAGLGVLVIVLGGLAATVAWIMGLIKTAQVKAWGWFVAVLLVSPIGSLIYGIAGPDQPATMPPPGYGMYGGPGRPPM